ncbi:MAG: FtsQ-type POTRA domain-containing protein [Nocardioides sp.]|nr:FtsQ-type POTRA domain-containing protein [Nocardioides sp.]
MARERLGAEERAALQTRRRFARRQWARRWLAWKYVVALLLLLVLVGGGTYTVYFSDALAAEGVEVTGERTLTDDQVREVAQVPVGDPLARVDVEAVRRRVESMPVVKSAEVSRQWPHDVLIEVEERTAVAVVEIAGSLRGLDAEGIVFGTYRKAPDELPRVRTTATTSGDALREAALVVAALPSDLAARINHVEVFTVDQIALELRDGRKVRWGSSAQSEEKAKVLEALLLQEAQVYDVSVPGNPTTLP